MNIYRYIVKYLVVGLLVTQISCTQKNTKLFELLTPNETNVDFRNDLKESADFNILNYIYYYNGGGVSVGDINNDGLPDIFFTANEAGNRLYLNKGNLEFEDISESAGVTGSYLWSTGCSMIDINGDSFLDIYVCNLGGGYQGKIGKNELFINQGNNAFVESAREYNLDFSGYSTQAAFFDYDNDDDLDVYLLNHAVHTDKSYGAREKVSAYTGIHQGDRLFRNNSEKAKLAFTDVTSSAQINSNILGYGLGVSTGDVNGDGCVDVYVSNDFHENDYLYINNCDGTFTESGQWMIGHTSRYSMGNEIADFNNDGLPDIITLDMMPDDISIFQRSAAEDGYDLLELKRRFGYGNQVVRNTLQLNMGDNSFADIAPLAGVEATDWSWAPLLADFDNDGWKDLFITNGIFKRPNDLDYINYYANESIKRSIANGVNNKNLSITDKMPSDKINNYIFRNNGDLKFTDRTMKWGLDQKFFSNGAAYSDLDLDGDLDIITNNINDYASIYKNKSDPAVMKYLKIALKGSGKNIYGIGAKVILKSKNQILYQEHFPVRGFQSSVDYILNFGLGKKISLVDSVVVIWPGGTYEVKRQVEANSFLSLSKNSAKGNYYKEMPPLRTEGMFRNFTDSLKFPFRHRENKFYDKNREILIPHSISNEGPRVAVGDVNGDGLQDLFIGGSRRYPGKLFVQDRKGEWTNNKQSEIENDSMYEDIESLFLDIDGDEDLDLYVVSGGNEYWKPGSPLGDRIYRNDGNGNFVRHDFDFEGNYINNSCVAAGDYDNDGDFDLFVGGRVEPWKYGINPTSFLLENDGKGNFKDVTKLKAKSLHNIGMVTDAVWSDVDLDGNLDLMVIGEWMPVTVFHNDGKQLINITDQTELAATFGLWNTIESADFDNDGDFDFVVGNYGLNSKLEASPDSPLMLFVKDFDENGTTDPIIGIYKDRKLYPLATLNELADQMPHLKKKFTSYSQFSGKTISDIFDRHELSKAITKKVSILQSVYLENKGGNSFKLLELPNEVQFSPVYAIISHDFNEDGYLDILLGGNMFNINPNLGRHDAGKGWFLKGRGDGTFHVLYPVSSRFESYGQIRDLEIVCSPTGKTMVMVARNNDKPQFFEIKNSDELQ